MLETAYIPFTSDELTALAKIPATIIDREFFQNYNYSLDNQAEPDGSYGTNGIRQTNFYNPETLKNNLWLHTWKVLSTSPYRQAVVFTLDTPAVTSIEISPSESTVSAGIPVQLTAKVSTTGFANKAVIWSVDEAPGQKPEHPVTVDLTGKVTIPSSYSPTDTSNPNPIVIKATSVFDNTVTQTATITVL